MLRKSLLALIMLCSLPSAGASFGAPTGTGPQQEFAKLVESKSWRDALLAWNQAYSGTGFAQSVNGQALHAYLLFKNGLRMIAIETVLSLNAKEVNTELLQAWKADLIRTHYVQKSWVQTNGSWRKIVGPGEVPLALANNKQIVKAYQYASQMPMNMIREKSQVWWQIATRAPQINETNFALQSLKNLKSSGQSVIEQDQVAMATGRVLYQRNQLDEAIAAYNEVPKSSDLWLEAVEERAWAYLRKGDYDQAMGQVTTILAPTFEKLVGPEPYFLSNLLSLKVCDYPRIFKVGEMFKNRNRERLAELQNLANTGTNGAMSIVFERMDSKGVTLAALGPQANLMPRALLKDREFLKHMQYRHVILEEVKAAAELMEDISSLGTNAELNKMVADSRARAEKAKVQAMARARKLAAAETAEFRQILKKMHVVEAEVIQRLHMDDNLKGERGKLTDVKDPKNVLVFQYDDEVWMDELDNYKARVKDCPTLKGASL